MCSMISKYIGILLIKIFIYHYLCVHDVLVSTRAMGTALWNLLSP